MSEETIYDNAEIVAAKQAVCDLVWQLLESWDTEIQDHDDQLHVLLKDLITKTVLASVESLTELEHEGNSCYWPQEFTSIDNIDAESILCPAHELMFSILSQQETT